MSPCSIPAIALLGAAAVGAPDDGPVAYWPFDEGEGTVVHDSVGASHGSLHGCTFVRCGKGYALWFDGEDDWVEFGSPPALAATDALTLEVWVYPEAVPTAGEAGIVGRAYGDYVLTYYTDSKCYWYGGSGGRHASGDLSPGAWRHVVATFDDDTLRLYIDGEPISSARNEQPVLRNGVAFAMGTSLGGGEFTRGAHFRGMLDDVCVYLRGLTADEVRQRFATTHLTGELSLSAAPCYGTREILVHVGLRDLGEIEPGSTVVIQLARSGAMEPLATAMARELTTGASVDVTIRAPGTGAGNYILTAQTLGPEGKPVGLPASCTVTWPKAPRWHTGDAHLRVLNSLVTELRHVTDVRSPGRSLWFTNPREGWVFITSACEPGRGRIRVSLPGLAELPIVIERDAASAGLAEGFRRLPAGRYELLIECTGGARVRNLAVRAVPEIGFCQVDRPPQIDGLAPVDWPAFLRLHILPNINLAVSNGDPAERELWRVWREQGKRWVVQTAVPGFGKTEGVSAEDVEHEWLRSPAVDDPNLTGMIVDEFWAGDEPIWAAWREGLKRLQANPRFAGKVLYPYCTPLFGAPGSRVFARAVFDAGWAVALERYFPEPHTEREARAYIKAHLTDVLAEWARVDPDVVAHTLVIWGFLISAPNETLNVDPSVDYRAFMDLQFHTLATNPAFFGLYGVASYLSGYSDEETMRFVGRVYRHYCLEGRTDRLWTQYELRHIENPDFERRLEGWTADEAEPGSITTGSLEGLSWLEGRYPPTSRGNTYMAMRRSGQKANVARQTIGELRPGETYSVKLISADLDDLTGGVSDRKELGMRVELEGVEVIPGRSFVEPFASCYSHVARGFTADRPAWFQLQRMVFRARGETAELRITDWPVGKPGGPVGQQLLCNFVELQTSEAEP